MAGHEDVSHALAPSVGRDPAWGREKRLSEPLEGRKGKGFAARPFTDPACPRGNRDVEEDAEQRQQAEAVQSAVVRGDEERPLADGDTHQRRVPFVGRRSEAIPDFRQVADPLDPGQHTEVRVLLDRGRQPGPELLRFRCGRAEFRFEEDAPGNGGVAVEPDDAVGVVGGERQWSP
ncbi:hypothetical protein [Amycolatopsis sp. NPDC003731]